MIAPHGRWVPGGYRLAAIQTPIIRALGRRYDRSERMCGGS